MDQDNKEQQPLESPKDSSDRNHTTPTHTRIFAWIGVIFMVLLVLGYTYSVATGKIFLW